MGRTALVSTVLCLGSALLGCGGSSNSGAPTKWLGSMPHLQIVGTLQGETINVDITEWFMTLSTTYEN